MSHSPDATSPDRTDQDPRVRVGTLIFVSRWLLLPVNITLVALLKDFQHIEFLDWVVVEHRVALHGVAVTSTLLMAVIWRIMHPAHLSHPAPSYGDHS